MEKKWLNMMRDKLGLFGEDKNDKKLINNLLNWMEKNKIDYTNTFCHLMKIKTNDENYRDDSFISWLAEWKKRSKFKNHDNEKQINLMRENNPVVIPRNSKVEESLSEAEKGNFLIMHKLLEVLKKPYVLQENIAEYQKPSPISKNKYQTYCGT